MGLGCTIGVHKTARISSSVTESRLDHTVNWRFSRENIRAANDAVVNIRDTGVFCVNVVEYAMKDAMNQTSGPWEATTDEFALAEIEKTPCSEIDCARVAAAPAALECKMTRIVQIEGAANFVAFGEVIGVHMRDDGIFGVLRYNPLTRLGDQDYSVVRDKFSLIRPGE